MTFLQTLYYNSPSILQTFLLNVYGLKTQSIFRKSLKILSKYSSSEIWDRDFQINYVSNRLRLVLSHAIKSVPRYASLSNLLHHLEDPKCDVFSLLLEFPIITREEVLHHTDIFTSAHFKHSHKFIKSKTSGTTGTPFTTFMDTETFNTAKCFELRRNYWSGYTRGDWIARLVGDPIISIKDNNPSKPWRISWTDKRIYLSSFHLNNETCQHYLNVLDKYRPKFIMGYPSSLEILSSYAIVSDFSLNWRPSAIFYSSEPMYDHQYNKISHVFRAPIRGFYGNAEKILSAAQCESNNYHLSLVDGYLEGQFFLIPSSSPALITTLLNNVMPLIRFQLGDDITVSPDYTCRCGRTLPIIEPVITKEEDFIITPSDRRISSSVITFAFKDLKGIRRSQIVQDSKNSLIVFIDSTEDVYSQIVPLLSKSLNDIFFNEIDLNFVRNCNIQLTRSGKTRFVVRKF